MKKIKINSNISLHYIPMTKLKTTTISVYIHRPLNKEEASKNAILPYVIKRGGRLCPDASTLSRYLEELYGASLSAGVLKRGDGQMIYLCFETISDKFAPNGEKLTESIMKLMISVLFEPVSFTEDTVEQEKKNAKDRIAAEMNDKRRYAMIRCTEEMCKGESFAISVLGTPEGVDAVTAESLKEYYEDIISSSIIDIYVCGECDFEKLTEYLKEYTADMQLRKALVPKTEIFKGNGEMVSVTDRMDVVQGKLCMGFTTGISRKDKEYIPLEVMISIYGGGAHSKLFNNVREKLSLCYYASARLVNTKGIVFVNAGIEFQNFQKAYDEILAQLDCIKNGEISEAEFDSSVRALLNQMESYKDNQLLMQLFCIGEELAGTECGIDEIKEAIKNVTLKDVCEVAEKVRLDTVYFLAGKEEK